MFASASASFCWLAVLLVVSGRCVGGGCLAGPAT